MVTFIAICKTGIICVDEHNWNSKIMSERQESKQLTDTPFSVLDLATILAHKTPADTYKNSVHLARHVEEWGFKRYWLAEHHSMESIASSATSVLIGHIAGQTSSIRVGAGGIMLPNHAPLVIAEQFGTLESIYPGRIDLGLGRAPGTDPQTAQAIRPDFMQAAQLFPEEVAKIERYFSPENRKSTVRAAIAEGTDVPIYILGSSTDSAHLAASKGLPYAFASHFASTYLLQALKIYKHEFQASDVLSQPYTMAGVNVFIADTDEEAEQLFTSLIRMFVGVLTGARQPIQPPTEMNEELRELHGHPAVHQMLKYSFVGSKQTVRKQVSAFLDQTGVDELIVVSAMYDLQDRLKSVRLFAEIMQELNEGK